MARSTHRTATLAFCVLILLTGCNGLLDDVTGEKRGSYDVPERHPPGIDQDGVTDTRVLLANHTAALRNRSVTVRSDHVQRFRDNDTVRYQSRTTERVGESGSYFTVYRRDGYDSDVLGTSPRRVERWSNGSTALLKVTRNGTTDYRPTWPLAKGQRARYETLLLLLSDIDPTLDGTRTLEGREVYVLRANRDNMSIGLPNDRVARTARNLSFVAWVEQSGLVRGYRLEYDVSIANSTVRVTETLAFEDIGSTTVPRPSWVETAVETVDPSVRRDGGPVPRVGGSDATVRPERFEFGGLEKQ